MVNGTQYSRNHTDLNRSTRKIVIDKWNIVVNNKYYKKSNWLIIVIFCLLVPVYCVLFVWMATQLSTGLATPTSTRSALESRTTECVTTVTISVTCYTKMTVTGTIKRSGSVGVSRGTLADGSKTTSPTYLVLPCATTHTTRLFTVERVKLPPAGNKSKP